MKRKRHSAAQVVTKLREADKALAEGAGVGQVCKQIGISEHTYYRWRKHGSLTSDQAKRLKNLERENAKLHKRLAELTEKLAHAEGKDATTLQLEIAFLKEALDRQNRALYGTSSEKRGANGTKRKKDREPQRGRNFQRGDQFDS